eukprot:216411-Amphidinium_carterae.1
MWKGTTQLKVAQRVCKYFAQNGRQTRRERPEAALLAECGPRYTTTTTAGPSEAAGAATEAEERAGKARRVE